MIRVMLAEDSFLVREGLREILESLPGIEVTGTHSDLDALLSAIEADPPGVVITDIRMPPDHTDEGIRAAAELRRTHPEMGVVILSQYAYPAYVLELLDSGSDGRAYLLKERVHDRDQLTAAIEAVAGGGSVIDPKIVEVLVTARSRAESSGFDRLTAREREVLSEIAQGKSNVAIASSLYLSKRAVEKHIHSIFMKLGLAAEVDVSKRVKAALLYLSHGPETSEPMG